jgi:MFS family permease
MVSHALVHTYELSIPILVVVWLTEFSMTTAELGAVVAVGYALFGIGALPSGVLVDRYSSKRLMIVCMGGMGLSFFILSAAQGVVMIAIALSVWGVAASIHHPAALSLISTGIEARGTGFAYHGMAGNLGIGFGPMVTAILLLVLDWRVTTAVLVLPAVVAVLYALSAEFDETAAVDDDQNTGTDERVGGISGFLQDSRKVS